MTFLNEWSDRLDNLGPVAAKVGHKAEGYACRIIEQLDDLNAGVANLYPDANAYDYQRLAVPAAGNRLVEGRQGYSKVIENIAIVAAAAVDVDLYVMSQDDAGFVRRFSLTAAGRSGTEVKIPVPEGQAYIIVASVAAQVNVIARRIKP